MRLKSAPFLIGIAAGVAAIGISGCAPLRSTIAGIFEFGLIATKPLPNCSPCPMRISHASYSAPLCPSASSSSSSTVTFTPFGVPCE